VDGRERAALIELYRDGYQTVVAALVGADVDAREAPKEWSPRDVVHHLADSELSAAIRLRRMLVEDRPLVQWHDQDAFARALFYDRPIDASLATFRAARDSNAEILARLSEEQWQREAVHSQSGPYSVEAWLRLYVDHTRAHVDQIRRSWTT
jgi:hypothetical protein